MARYLTRGFQVGLDLAVLSVAFWAGFCFRFEFTIPPYWIDVALVNWPLVLALEYAVLAAFGVPRFSWRYIGMRETVAIAIAVTLSSTILIVFRLALHDIGHTVEIGALPLGVLATNFFLGLVGLAGVRGSRRVYAESKARKLRASGGEERTRVLLVGAGEAGVMVAREIASRPDLALQPVGFLDDNAMKIGTQIAGLPVLGRTSEIAKIAERKRVDRVLITIANAPGPDIRRLVLACREAGLETKIIPGIYEIVGDRVNLSRIREVAIEDLLGREPVKLDEAVVASSIRDQVVLVTGAGGSIGSELCRQVCRFGPGQVVLLERFENALFEIHRELIGMHPELQFEPVVADICDSDRMEQIFERYRPTLVLHAAAHKHVPMMEANPGEAIKNNVGGTRTVATLSVRFGVARFVMISTDKAVNPSSVMGASKRIAEIYIQHLAHQTKTRFMTVRFGNVLGSNGSVIPIFKEQIALGGPVTVTHPDMERYFMTIPEASQLVLQAGAMGKGGEVFILDMGKPVKIVDLARDLISLSGLKPDDDIEVRFVGMRPGEKLVEELVTRNEIADRTTHPKVLIGRRSPGGNLPSVDAIERLITLATTTNDKLRASISTLVPEYAAGLPHAIERDQETKHTSQPGPEISTGTERQSELRVSTVRL